MWQRDAYRAPVRPAPPPSGPRLFRPRDHLRVLSVSTLPAPSSLQRCPGGRLYADNALPEALVLARDPLDVYLDLFPNLPNECPFHAADWGQATSVAVAIFRSTTLWSRASVWEECARQSDDPELKALWSLIDDPIEWYDERGSLNNGSHRLCALRSSGAPEVLVAVQPLS